MNIRFILERTSHPGNIGAAARAMKTMGQSELVLVAPKHFPDAEATARAAGADDLLANATVVDTIAEALTGCELVAACSARDRHLSWPVLTPREYADMAMNHSTREMGEASPHVIPGAAQSDAIADPESEHREAIQQHKGGASTPTVAVIFGNERTGLSNADFALCHYQIHIPTNPEYSSLNLAAAVQIIAYEFYCVTTAQPPKTSIADTSNAKAKQASEQILTKSEDLSRFYEHLERVLLRIGYMHKDNPKLLMHRLHRLFNRAQLEHLETQMLRGILTSVEKNTRPSNVEY